MISRRKCVEQPSQKPPGKFFLSVGKEWQNWRTSLVRFLQTSDFPAIGEGDLKLVLILINTGPKDQILTMTLTAPQSVIVYAESTTHTQGETAES